MSKYKILFIMVSILLLTRVGALLFFIDKLFNGEELHHGVIAKEIMEGPDLSIFEYPLTNYGHGGLWSGILTIPFFALFGKNLFALLLTPVAFSTGILIILFLFAYKFFNRRVAIITGLLYIFSSRIWFAFNFHTGGLHFENVIFTVGAMYLFYEIIFNGKSKPIYYFSLGLVSGFGTYWVYTYLVTAAAILLLWLLRDKRMFLRKAFYVFLAGFLVGMLPWFYYNLGTHFESIKDVILDGFFGPKNYLGLKTWLDTIQRFLEVICFSRMLSLGIQDNIFGKLYLVIYWLSFLYILRLYKFSFAKIISSKESFVLTFPVLLLIIAAFYGLYVEELKDSTYYLDWRHVVGLFPFVFLTVAIALDRLFLKFKALKAVSLAALSIPVIAGTIIGSTKINLKDFGSGFNQLGYSYIFLFDAFHSKYTDNLYKILDNITKLSAPEKYEVLSLIYAIDPIGESKPVDFKEYLKLSLRVDEKHKPIFYKILIKGLFCNLDMPLKDIVHQVDVLSRQVEDRYKPYFYEGIGALVTTYDIIDTIKYKEYASFIDKKYRAYYYRGLSEPNYSGIPEYFDRFKNCLAWLDKQYQPLYLEGVGEVLAKQGVWYAVIKACCNQGDAPEFYNLFRNLESGNKIYVLKGVGKSLSYFYSVNTEKAIHEFINNFNEDDKKTILEAMASNLRQE